MSTAVTRCPAAARARSVHPAPAMLKTRLRGLKARSHGVDAASVGSIKAILCGNPNKHQKSEVLNDHADRIGNHMPGPIDPPPLLQAVRSAQLRLDASAVPTRLRRQGRIRPGPT